MGMIPKIGEDVSSDVIADKMMTFVGGRSLLHWGYQLRIRRNGVTLQV